MTDITAKPTGSLTTAARGAWGSPRANFRLECFPRPRTRNVGRAVCSPGLTPQDRLRRVRYRRLEGFGQAARCRTPCPGALARLQWRASTSARLRDATRQPAPSRRTRFRVARWRHPLAGQRQALLRQGQCRGVAKAQPLCNSRNGTLTHVETPLRRSASPLEESNGGIAWRRETIQRMSGSDTNAVAMMAITRSKSAGDAGTTDSGDTMLLYVVVPCGRPSSSMAWFRRFSP